MFSWAQKRTNYWSGIRKRAPKVPDITCPAIDNVLDQLEKQIGREFKLGKLSIFIDDKNIVYMNGPVSDIKNIEIKICLLYTSDAADE